VHLLKGQTRGLDDGAQAVDLEQTPGDIVILSAADTEIAGLASARRALGRSFATVRLANWMALKHPFSVDLYGEAVLGHARLIAIRLLGGLSYWRYGVEEAQRIARATGAKLILVPGDATWDQVLAREGSVGEDEARRFWSYLMEGGSENFADALRFCAHLIGEGASPPDARPLPTAGFHGKEPATNGDRPAVAIVFYRALLQAGQTEPVDALCRALAGRGLDALPIYVSSLKMAADAAFVETAFADHDPALVLNATAFALSKAGVAFSGTPLDGGTRPVLQVTFAGVSRQAWAESTRGLSPSDLTMNVVLPEIDGRIIGRAVSFKQADELDPLTECRPVRYRPEPDRIDFVAELAARWTRLQTKANGDKRLGIVLSNYPNRDGRLANGVGLDAPSSTVRLIEVLSAAGFDTGDAPSDARSLMDLLLAGPTNAIKNGDPRRGSIMLSIDLYRKYFKDISQLVQHKIEEKWDSPDADPFVTGDEFVLPAHCFGNLVIGIQPARGYNIDAKATYHDPDLVPPHGYLAFYFWLREEFGADAILHMGKHGNLEWLPGKALALSRDCFPDAILGPIPLIYPFIVNDPGEGAQAKRRTAAVIVDHLMPAMARAETYGPAAELETLIDEYAAAMAGDPRRAEAVAAQIFELAGKHGFDADLGLDPKSDRDTALIRLDEHICDLKELQIRDGLHIFGEGPQGRQRAETLVALARVPRGSGKKADASLLRALADDLGLGDFDPLACSFAEAWRGPRPDALKRVLADDWRTHGDTVERLEALALALVEGGPCPEDWPAARAVLGAIQSQLAPALDQSGGRETGAVLDALAGRFVAPGPSGAPSRGRADCLPTGRNFYSLDVRAVPTPAAWDLGRRSADLLVKRYFQDEGAWPQAMALTVWGTSNMRTGGDDIAQALALIGVKPVWEAASGRVTGIEVIALADLARPRVDVTLRISGFFRDAFPAQIELFHEAVQAIAARDEPDDANPIAARIGIETDALVAAGVAVDEARKAASFRIFGSRPGAYGAGLQALIDEGIWADRSDLASAFLEWSAYAYGGGSQGGRARPALEARLKTIDAVVQNQDNREHDLLDSDDYYQFQGGLSSAVETLRGEIPRTYHNDHSRPERPVIRVLDEEIARVVRGRAANPKWLAGVMRHGYKGAFEIAATVDYLFAFAATTNAVRGHHFEQLYEAYLMDDAVREFIADNNAPALAEIAARFCEAVDRGLWAPRRNSAYDELSLLAGRGDTKVQRS
jgi:cobaltochelatase CobN